MVWGIFVFFGCVWGFAGVWGVAWLNFWRLCHFERSEKSIMNFVLAIHPAFFMDTSLTPQYDKKCPSLRAVFLKNGVAIYVDLGKFFWGLGFVGTLEICHFERSEKSIEFKTRFNFMDTSLSGKSSV